MDYAPQKYYEPPQYGTQSRRSGIEPPNGDKPYDAILQVGPRVAGRSVDEETKPKKPVYDILNCGPRARFVVRGQTSPFIVHNCCQALARIIIGEQLILIAKKYPVVMTVHDAVACLIKKDEVTEGLKHLDSSMKFTPEWATGLPLTCELGYGESYSDVSKKKALKAWGF
jgi:hypothetical protein